MEVEKSPTNSVSIDSWQKLLGAWGFEALYRFLGDLRQ